MTTRWCAVLCAVLATTIAPAQDEGFRFFLDVHGVGLTENRPAATPLDFINPTVAGAGRFYLYLQYGTNNQAFSVVNLRILVGGDAVFTGGRFYNKNPIAGVPRWQAITGDQAPSPGATDWVINSAFKVGGGGYGAKNATSYPWDLPVHLADTHFRYDDGSQLGTTLLGYFDVAYTGAPGGDPAELWIGSGDSGSGGVTINSADFVYFGFGDAGTTNKGDRTSELPDGYVAAIPEPAGVLLALLGAVVVRRK